MSWPSPLTHLTFLDMMSAPSAPSIAPALLYMKVCNHFRSARNTYISAESIDSFIQAWSSALMGIRCSDQAKGMTACYCVCCRLILQVMAVLSVRSHATQFLLLSTSKTASDRRSCSLTSLQQNMVVRKG